MFAGQWGRGCEEDGLFLSPGSEIFGYGVEELDHDLLFIEGSFPFRV